MMEIIKSFGKHKYEDRLCFITTLKICTRTLTSYTTAPITPKHLRGMKKNIRLLASGRRFPHEVLGCKNKIVSIVNRASALWRIYDFRINNCSKTSQGPS